MNVIALTPWDLTMAAGLMLMMAVSSIWLRLGLGKQIIIAGLRTTIQLFLIGFILKVLFEQTHLGWISLLAMVMLLVAGREVMARQKRRFGGWWGFGLGTLSMFVSSFSITVIVLLVIIQNDPWYQPQYAIPLLGMMLGNTMTGIALALDRLTDSAWQQRGVIESRLLLGHHWRIAIRDMARDSVRVGLVPMINAMAAAGLVSLPGMMTGQILSGTPPLEAVKYQILIMFMITAGTGFATMGAVWIGARRLFDERQRLRLERISK